MNQEGQKSLCLKLTYRLSGIYYGVPSLSKRYQNGKGIKLESFKSIGQF